MKFRYSNFSFSNILKFYIYDKSHCLNRILCTPGALDQNKIKGKILVCYDDKDNDGDEKSLPADQAGAIGMILVNA